MNPVSHLVRYAIAQVLGQPAERAVEFFKNHFTDHTQVLFQALGRANERSWQALGIALAGDRRFDQIRVFFASGDEKAIREQVRRFLAGNAVSFEGSPAEFRSACLDDLKHARKEGFLSATDPETSEPGPQSLSCSRDVIDGACEAVARVADALAPRYPNLARLLRQRPSGGPPLLVAAFAYFFRREVEDNQALAHGLQFDGLRQLSQAQEAAFQGIQAALVEMGDRFDAMLEQLGRIEAVAVETQAVAAATHSSVLDLHAGLQRLESLHLAHGDEVRRLVQETLNRLASAGMQSVEVRPQYSFSIRSEDERRAVRQLLSRFRELPAEEQQQLPALLNGLGKLQVGAGDFGGAAETFAEVARVVHDPSAQAEVLYNQYRAALEEKKWDDALVAIRQAVALAPRHFEPFPRSRYRMEAILGAGGFGTVFRCHDVYLNEAVVVKALHVADLERGMDEVFREARVLRQLSHPVIIGVRDDCGYADPDARARPYVVMDYFPGVNLDQFVREYGPLPPAELTTVAREIAVGVKAAHGRNVLHRDLKPENVLVRKEGDAWQVKIIDFGLALRKQVIPATLAARSAGGRTILSDSVAGTLRFAPPEQKGELPGITIGPHSDVYAFGKLCYYALFKTTEPKGRHWDTVPAGLRGPLKELLEHCTEEDLEHRLPSFDPVLEVLAKLLAPSRAEASHGRRGAGEAEQAEVRVPQRPNVEARQGQESEPGRLVVCAQGEGTHRTITDALRAAPAGAEIRVRPGLYKEGICLDKPVTILGDGLREQIIIESEVSSCLHMDTERALVKGITLRSQVDVQERVNDQSNELAWAVHVPRGHLVLEDCVVTARSLGCVVIRGGAAHPVIRGCCLHGSKAHCLLVYKQARGIIEGCEIAGSADSGIAVGPGCDLEINDCHIHENKGGIYVNSSCVKVNRCDIYHNIEVGLFTDKGADLTVRNCRIHDHTKHGLEANWGGRATVEDCEIFGNSQDGLHIGDDSNLTVRSCHIHGCRTGVYAVNGQGTVEGCTITRNVTSGVAIEVGGDLAVRNCRINQNNWGVTVTGERYGSKPRKSSATVENCDLTGNLQGAWIIHKGCQIQRRSNKE
jgi:tetratricopeptide (TPR) repeat protein/nitrous oxidase accessory protein NosD